MSSDLLSSPCIFLSSCCPAGFQLSMFQKSILCPCAGGVSVFSISDRSFLHTFIGKQGAMQTPYRSHMLTHSLKKGSLPNICGIFERSLKFPLDKKRFFDYENVLHTKGNGSFKKCSLKGSSGNPEWDLFGISVLKECILIILWPSIISSTGIFVAISNHTLLESKLSIFLLCKKIIWIRSCSMKIFCTFPTVNISKCNFWLVICITKNFIWTTLNVIFLFFFAPFRFCIFK